MVEGYRRDSVPRRNGWRSLTIGCHDHRVFGYGLLLSEQIMADRCPFAVYAGRARLHDYCFRVNSYGVPTLRPDVGGLVYGVIWWINSDELSELDYFEGVDQHFARRCEVYVVDESCSVVRAEAYIATSKRLGLPRHECLDAIIKAASRRAFPEAYINELQSWFERGY